MARDDGDWLGRHFDVDGAEDEGKTVRILPENVSPASRTTQDRYGQSQQSEFGSYEPASNRRSLATQPSRPLQVEDRPQPDRPQVVYTRRGPSACVILAATFSLLAVACALLAFATMQNGLSGLGKLTGLIPSFPSIVTTPTVTIDTSRPTVIDRVQALGKLETVHYQLEKVISGESTGPLPDFLTSDKILLVAHGEVVGGVDLTKMTSGDIVVVSDTVTITLPKAEILYSKLDNSKTYVYDRETGIFSKPDPTLETQVRQAAEQKIVQAALEDGILAQAQTNAQSVIRTLVTGLGYGDVRFK